MCLRGWERLGEVKWQGVWKAGKGWRGYVPRYLRVSEGIWVCLSVSECVWVYLKVSERLGKVDKGVWWDVRGSERLGKIGRGYVSECVWGCLKGWQRCLRVSERLGKAGKCVWVYQSLSEGIWWYLMVSEGIWVCLMMYERLRKAVKGYTLQKSLFIYIYT